MLFNTLFISLISLIAFASASGHHDLKCYTLSAYKGGGHGHVPTTTVTRTLTTTTTVTSTRTIRTRTTLPTVTNTVTETETETNTDTETTTSTIPAPAGFTPVTESSGYTSANTPGAKKRAVLELLFGRAQSSASLRYPKGYKPPQSYPKPKPRSVKCITTVTSTETAHTVTTTTSTIIIAPTTVSTTTATTTTTTTTTETTSFYAACATNNILGPVADPPGQYVQGVGNSDPNGVQQNIFPVASAYDCCVICLTGSTGIDNCQNTIYDADTQICNPIGGDPAVCGPGGTQGDIGSYVILTTTPMNRFDSNGPCGVLGPDPAV